MAAINGNRIKNLRRARPLQINEDEITSPGKKTSAVPLVKIDNARVEPKAIVFVQLCSRRQVRRK
jgi:hypothetical protein